MTNPVTFVWTAVMSGIGFAIYILCIGKLFSVTSKYPGIDQMSENTAQAFLILDALPSTLIITTILILGILGIAINNNI